MSEREKYAYELILEHLKVCENDLPQLINTIQKELEQH